MRSTELQQCAQRWLDDSGEDQKLMVDDGVVWLQRRGGHYFALAELSLDVSLNDQLLAQALQLSAPALRYFGGDAAALAQKGNSLILVLRIHQLEINAVCQQLESLLNQRDVWQTMLLQPRSKAATHSAVPLHSLAFLPRGNHG